MGQDHACTSIRFRYGADDGGVDLRRADHGGFVQSISRYGTGKDTDVFPYHLVGIPVPLRHVHGGGVGEGADTARPSGEAVIQIRFVKVRGFFQYSVAVKHGNHSFRERCV